MWESIVVLIIAAITALCSALAWLFRLDKRVDMLVEQHLSMKDMILMQLKSVNDRLERIERALNGFLAKL